MSDGSHHPEALWLSQRIGPIKQQSSGKDARYSESSFYLFSISVLEMIKGTPH